MESRLPACDEKHPIRPVDVNGINKLAESGITSFTTCMAFVLCAAFNQHLRTGDASQRCAADFNYAAAKKANIKVFDGEQLRDFNYVDDCVDAMLLAGVSEKANGKVYNLGSQEVLGLKAVAEMMTKLGYGGSFELVPFPEERKAIDIGDYYSDFSLISDELGWSPNFSLEAGLIKTLYFYSKKFDKLYSKLNV